MSRDITGNGPSISYGPKYFFFCLQTNIIKRNTTETDLFSGALDSNLWLFVVAYVFGSHRDVDITLKICITYYLLSSD